MIDAIDAIMQLVAAHAVTGQPLTVFFDRWRVIWAEAGRAPLQSTHGLILRVSGGKIIDNEGENLTIEDARFVLQTFAETLAN